MEPTIAKSLAELLVESITKKEVETTTRLAAAQALVLLEICATLHEIHNHLNHLRPQ